MRSVGTDGSFIIHTPNVQIYENKQTFCRYLNVKIK